MTWWLQIPCAVGHVDGDVPADYDDGAHLTNTFIIRDIPTPMLLPLPFSAAADADGKTYSEPRAAMCKLRAAMCKLRAAEVTGMGIPGKVWDAGLALAGR